MGRKIAILICGVFAFASVLIAQSSDDFKRERGGKTDEVKNGWEGKAPPKLNIKEWMNATEKAPTWESLKGKVIVLDFWAHW
ncbi:MAG: hypothetical protein KF784_03230 [Fimbriimonadaceae bacterium]|nr:hypothetical protein [Fimbriimonadaceae bacterium]